MNNVNVVKNGSFTKTEYVPMGYSEEPILFFNEWDWDYAVEQIDGVKRCIVSRTYDEESYSVCCKITVQSSGREVTCGHGIYQRIDLLAMEGEAKLDVEF